MEAALPRTIAPSARDELSVFLFFCAIVINNTYKVTVYATKAGYNNSDAATIEIQANSGVKGDVDGDGKVNVADHVELSKIILNQ